MAAVSAEMKDNNPGDEFMNWRANPMSFDFCVIPWRRDTCWAAFRQQEFTVHACYSASALWAQSQGSLRPAASEPALI